MSTIGPWYCSRGQKRAGPFETEQLHALIRAGKIKSTDLICPKNGDDWKPVSDWPDFCADNSVAKGSATARPRSQKSPIQSMNCPQCSHAISSNDIRTGLPPECPQCGLKLMISGTIRASGRQLELPEKSRQQFNSTTRPVEVTRQMASAQKQSINLRDVVIAQKLLILSLLPLPIAMFFWPQLLILWPLRILVLLLQMAAIIRLCLVIRLPAWKTIASLVAALAPFLALVPLLSVFSFFWLNMQANRVLRNSGLRSGFLGVSLSQMKDFPG
ncbi:hypothetical protein Plim_3073 [Planctopirus limnophila DSM 3776]|uniref:GYF domain-containing protein n=2 Tax=Planctopirus limnophila TaxID=120 RepID=D5SSU1_PLAL2|nr:hypothetical protein Plim_3073 [Planctopirus limnophila DSM 3776]